MGGASPPLPRSEAKLVLLASTGSESPWRKDASVPPYHPMNALCYQEYATRAVEDRAQRPFAYACSFDTLDKILPVSPLPRNQHRRKEIDMPQTPMTPIFCCLSSCIHTASNVSLWKCLPGLLILCHLNPPNLIRLHPVLAGSIVSKRWQTKGSSRECHGEESKSLQEVWYQARVDQSAENHDWP